MEPAGQTPSMPATRRARAADKPRRWPWIPTLREALISFAMAVVLLLTIEALLVESVVVPTHSMEPTILPNERALLVHFPPYRPQRFDIVVIKDRQTGTRYAKRIIGLPGERVRIDDGWRVSIDGKPLDYAPGDADHLRREAGHHTIDIAPPTGNSVELPPIMTITLGRSQYYLLGDHRLASNDSRALGPVPESEIQGPLRRVWYSYDLGKHRLRRERIGAKLE